MPVHSYHRQRTPDFAAVKVLNGRYYFLHNCKAKQMNPVPVEDDNIDTLYKALKKMVLQMLRLTLEPGMETKPCFFLYNPLHNFKLMW